MKKKITCPGCSAVYNIPINKLHKEVSRTTCRKCGHKIEVRKPSSSEFLIKDNDPDNTIPTPRGPSDMFNDQADNGFQMSPFSTEQFPPNPFEGDSPSSNMNISPNQFRDDYQDPSQPVDNSVTKPALNHSSPIAVTTAQTSHYRGLFALIGFGGLLASVFLPHLNSLWYGMIALGLSVPFFNALWPHNTKTPSLVPIVVISILAAGVFGGGHFTYEKMLKNEPSTLTQNTTVKSETPPSIPQQKEQDNTTTTIEPDVVEKENQEKVVEIKETKESKKPKEIAKVTKKTKSDESKTSSTSIERIKKKHRERRKLEQENGATPRSDPYQFNKGTLQSKKEGEQSINSLDQTFAEEQKKEVNNTEIPKSVIHTMLHNNKGIFACYREHRSLTGQYPSGVKIRFEVTPSGTIPKAFIVDGPFVGSRFEVCLRKAMREIVFPPTQGDTKEYEYKFLL